MEQQFRAVLLASSAVTALAGNRVDFGGNPQGATNPRVALWVISDAEGLTLDGPDGLSEGRVQADCYATSYVAAKELSRAVRTALDGYAGGGLRLVKHIGTRDMREGGTDEAQRLFRVSMDFSTFFTG